MRCWAARSPGRWRRARSRRGRAGFDPRITPARPDLAAQHLAGSVKAERFVEGKAFEIDASQAPLRSAASHRATLMTEALKGERITVYETSENGWAWGQLAGDGYVGFVPASALRAAGPAATHKVAALRTFVFPGPSIKLPPTETLSFGSRLAVARIDGSFAITAAGGHVSVLHLAPVTTNEADFVAVAERFLGTPYLWGGKTSLGTDCSGLLQLALNACGVACPRDTDMQEQALGSALARPQRATTIASRRSRVLEGPCRHRAGRRDGRARQRLPSHGGRVGADRGSPPPHSRHRRRHHQRASPDAGLSWIGNGKQRRLTREPVALTRRRSSPRKRGPSIFESKEPGFPHCAGMSGGESRPPSRQDARYSCSPTFGTPEPRRYSGSGGKPQIVDSVRFQVFGYCGVSRCHGRGSK